MSNLGKVYLGLLTAALLMPFTSSLFAAPAEDPKQGVVVEKITKESEGERAGIREGDVILNWGRGESRGTIESPFDLAGIEIEQAPRGQVILEGYSGASKKSWTLGPGVWGIGARPQMSDSLLLVYRQGQEMTKAGKLAEAAENWRTIAGQAKGPTEIWFLYQTAKMWADARRWEAADHAYQEVVETAANAGSVIKTQLFLAWGDIYQNRSDWKNAESCYQRSIAESGGLGAENLTVAKGLNNLGTISRRREDLVKAEEYHHRALEISQKLAPGSLDVATSLNSLGVVAFFRGGLVQAGDYSQQALKIQETIAPYSLDIARTLSNLGNTALRRGDPAMAKAYLQRALDIDQKLVPDSLELANISNNLGLVAQDTGDLARAEEYHLRALEIRQKLAPDSLAVAASFNNLSNIATEQGDVAKAEHYLHQALVIKQRLAPGSLDTSYTLDNLGVNARIRGDLAEAEEYNRQALDIKQRVVPGSMDVALSLFNLGEITRYRQEWVKAADYHRQALEIRQKVAPESIEASESYHALAEMARDQMDLAKAEEYCRQESAIRGKLSPASREYAASLVLLAGIMRRKAQTASAVELYEQALNVFENQNAQFGGTEETRSNFRAIYSNYFLDYIDLLMSEKKPDLAFHVAERWRARSLLEMLAAAHVDIRQGVDPELRARERSLQESLKAKSDQRITLLAAQHTEKQVAEVEKDIGDLRNQYDDFQARIRANSPIYASLTYPQPLSMPEVQQLLDKDTVLLNYVLGEERSYAWAVTQDSLTGYELPPRARIEDLARRLHQMISRVQGASGTRLETTASALSKMVLAPLAARITKKRLLIVSDGALQYVPFEVLPVSGRSNSVPLVVEHEIVYAPSASVLAELRREAMGRMRAPKAVAVLADPVFDRDDPRISRTRLIADHPHAISSNQSRSPANDRLARSVADVGLDHLSRLSYSRREAQAIMAVTPPGQGKKALDFEANRATATGQELYQYRIVHFATHALSDNKHPELSGLILSLVDQHGQSQNGFLDLQDIYNLNLRADMVVLSACETALGKEVQGEGLIGLTRGFMYAGATRVLASLWKVDDVATAALMARFYRAMEQQGLPPAAALRQAQLSLWRQKRWTAPYYWAGFQLQGEWK